MERSDSGRGGGVLRPQQPAGAAVPGVAADVAAMLRLHLHLAAELPWPRRGHSAAGGGAEQAAGGIHGPTRASPPSLHRRK